MIFSPTSLEGSYLIDLERHEDDRGFFARSWCAREFEEHGLAGDLKQCNISYNAKRGTLRGMHYQDKPFEEVRLVRCTRGSIYDVIIDLRPQSVTFRKHVGVTLSEEKRNALYVPKGFAHGFITLQDEVEVFYQMSEFYHPECARGVRWDDSAFGLRWPIEVQVISERDRTYPDFAL